MSALRRIRNLWRNLVSADRVEQELTDEMQEYLALLTDEKIAQGLGPDEARRAALVEIGGVEQVKEGVREVRAGRHLEIFLQDVRFGARVFLRAPGFSLVAVLTLGLGIGASTAIFSFVDGVLLRPLRFPDPDRIIWLDGVNQKKGISESMSMILSKLPVLVIEKFPVPRRDARV